MKSKVYVLGMLMLVIVLTIFAGPITEAGWRAEARYNAKAQYAAVDQAYASSCDGSMSSYAAVPLVPRRSASFRSYSFSAPAQTYSSSCSGGGYEAQQFSSSCNGGGYEQAPPPPTSTAPPSVQVTPKVEVNYTLINPPARRVSVKVK